MNLKVWRLGFFVNLPLHHDTCREYPIFSLNGASFQIINVTVLTHHSPYSYSNLYGCSVVVVNGGYWLRKIYKKYYSRLFVSVVMQARYYPCYSYSPVASLSAIRSLAYMTFHWKLQLNNTKTEIFYVSFPEQAIIAECNEFEWSIPHARHELKH